MRASTDIVGTVRAAIESKGWTETSERSGVHRCVLHHAFSHKRTKGPSLRTVERVLPALGLELVVRGRR